jgi:serine/threonine-protein kinase
LEKEHDNEVLFSVAEAINKGQRVDWDKEITTHPHARGLLSNLRVVESLRAAYRATAQLAGTGPGSGGRDSFPSSPSRDDAGRFLPGARVAGRYRIISLVGHGGMGEVYRADDLKLRQGVALKFLPIGSEKEASLLDRLLNEVRLARQVSHPNVCRLYDVAEADGRHFVSMEFVDGEDLASLLKRVGRLPPEKALEIARQLCAGLDATHQQGILHRDLKPANIMLDGRGRVRITDFGLAAAGLLVEGREARAGTPAYQAPEQLDGREATVRSDLYALGLVLYEVFSGRRAFPGETLSEIRRKQVESIPPSLSSLVDGIEPTVERAIERGLELPRVVGPPGGRAGAPALPGGDPLTAAVAAGETPSPELVAASGPRGVLTPHAAYALLGAVFMLQVIWVALSDRASVLGWMPSSRSAQYLTENARDILRRLGHKAEPLDSASRVYPIDVYSDYVSYQRSRDTSPDRWKAFRQPGEVGVAFVYRQAPSWLIPLGSLDLVTASDPRPGPGNCMVTTDLRGRLHYLEVRPPNRERSPEPATTPDWLALFELAGLDPARYQPAEPQRTPPVFVDSRAGWSGTLPDFGDLPVRIEAGAYHGRPVFFEVVTPWDPFWTVPALKPPTTPATPARQRFDIGSFVNSLVFSSVPVIALIFVFRSLRRGRADRRGAIRVAVTVFSLRFGWWALGGHHVLDFQTEVELFLRAASVSLSAAGAAWCLYVGFEPYVRRMHPEFLIAWTRLLHGRLGNPLVGRDLLIGLAMGGLSSIFLWQLYTVIPHLLGMESPPPPLYHPGPGWSAPPSEALLGGRHTLAALPVVGLVALNTMLSWTTLLFALRLVLRKDRIAVPIMVAIMAAAAPTFDFTWPAVLCTVIGSAAGAWTIYRLGLVATLGACLSFAVANQFPITADIHAPHFGTGLVGVLLILALASWGAMTAMAARPLTPAGLPPFSEGR